LAQEQQQPLLMIQRHLGFDLLLLLLLLGAALALPQRPLALQQLAPLLLLQRARLPLACGALLLAACAAPALAHRLGPSHACTAAVHLLLLPSCDQAVQHLEGTQSTAPVGAHVALRPCESAHVAGLACQVVAPLLLLLLLLAPLPLQVHTRQALLHHNRLQAPCRGAAQLQGWAALPACPLGHLPAGLLLLHQGTPHPLLLQSWGPAAAAAEGAACAVGSSRAMPAYWRAAAAAVAAAAERVPA
jgi:hypothetical protein